jgi:hypothetical protein
VGPSSPRAIGCSLALSPTIVCAWRSPPLCFSKTLTSKTTGLCWLSQNRVDKRSCIERLKAHKITCIPLVTLIPIALEIDCRDLTNRVKIPFTLVQNGVGSPSMHRLNEPPWRVEAPYQLLTLEKERVHIESVTLPWRVGFTPH